MPGLWAVWVIVCEVVFWEFLLRAVAPFPLFLGGALSVFFAVVSLVGCEACAMDVGSCF